MGVKSILSPGMILTAYGDVYCFLGLPLLPPLKPVATIRKKVCRYFKAYFSAISKCEHPNVLT